METTEKTSRRDFLRDSLVGAVAILSPLTGLEAQLVDIKPKEKTPEDYGIEMNTYYNVGLFLCNGHDKKKKLSELKLKDFKGINKGLTFKLNEEGELENVGCSTYKKDEPLYLVIYNPKKEDHRLGINVSEVIGEEGVKFIDGKPYHVKIRRGKIVEQKPFTSKVEREDLFYDLFRREQGIILPSEFETHTKKGPFKLERSHKIFLLGKLTPGVYNSSLELYKGNEVNTTMAFVGGYFEITE